MIHILIGDEYYLIKKSIDEILAQLNQRSNDFELFNFNENDRDYSFEEVLECLNTPSLFSSIKVIVLNNFQGLTQKSSLKPDELKTLGLILADPTSNVIILQVNTALDQRKALTKQLQQNAKIHDLRKKYNFDDLFSSLIKDNQLELDRETQHYLKERVSKNIDTMEHELEKLSLYNTSISREDIDALVSLNFDDRLNELSEAIMNKKIKLTWSIYFELMQLRFDQFQLIAYIAANLRSIYQFNVLVKQGYSMDEISELTGISTKQAYFFNNNRRVFDTGRLLGLLNQLSDLDQRSKTGQIDKRLGFELFLLKAVS